MSIKLQLVNLAQKIRLKCLHYKKIIAGVFIMFSIALILLIIVCNMVIGSHQKYVLMPSDVKHAAVGLVLGAGVNSQGKPYRELQARLDVAAEALHSGRVDSLILSGDNRFEYYNEPDAMVKYLAEVKNVPANKLHADYAGRSTYESCERASKIFGLQETIIFSAGSHLPRAIFICRHFGIESYGISSEVEANNSTRRELLARVKAMFNVYINGENTILGDGIRITHQSR